MKLAVRWRVLSTAVGLMLSGVLHAAPPVTSPAAPALPRAEAQLSIRVFPQSPALERAGGLQHLNFEFRLDAQGGALRLLNVLVRTRDKSGALQRFRQLVPSNYQDNFSDVALFEQDRFLGAQSFDVTGPIPPGGRVLFLNPWHSFGADEPLSLLEYTFYYVDDHGRVATSTVEVRPVEARPVLTQRLPFAGRWLVMEGHDYETHHRRIFSPVNAQRYASDFVTLHADDTLYKGDGTRLTDYASFGAEVLATGAGTVVARENGLTDNPVGARDDQQPYGNHVAVDHGGGYVSVLAHLMKGSLLVNVGDKVSVGQVLGKVGNSGASDLPHLHYHLQRGTELHVARAEGVVAIFSRYLRLRGKEETLVENGSPGTGELVKPEASSSSAAPGNAGATPSTPNPKGAPKPAAGSK